MDERVSYSISEAAKVMGVSRNFMYSRVLPEPDFPQVRIGNRVLIPKTSLEQWLEKHAARKE